MSDGVECSGKDCPHGNWMHNDCIGLNDLFETELMSLGKYYCKHCMRKEKKGRHFPTITEQFEDVVMRRSRNIPHKNKMKKKGRRTKKNQSQS